MPPKSPSACSLRNRIGLNLLNFFIPEVVAVALPFVSDALKQAHWAYDTIGIALSMSSLGALLFQIPAGIISDSFHKKRGLLGAALGTLGIAYLLLSLSLTPSTHRFNVYGILFLGGAASAFFAPLLSSLALYRTPPQRLGELLGENQAWGHLGNIAVAWGTFQAAPFLGVKSLFCIFTGVSLSAVFSLLIIGSVHAAGRAEYKGGTSHLGSFQTQKLKIQRLLIHPKTVQFLLATLLLHLSNAPVIPLVALHLRELGGTHPDLSLLILTSQFVMIFAAAFIGLLIRHIGIFTLYRFVFFILALRTALYPLFQNTWGFLALQLFDGIGNGLYGVVIVLICQKLSEHTQTFHSWIGIMATLLGLGGVLGPLIQGFLSKYWGITPSYVILASCGFCAFLLFTEPAKPDRLI